MEGDIDSWHCTLHFYFLLAAVLCTGPLHSSHKRQSGSRCVITQPRKRKK
ncbi:MAG: hypothetical protein ACK55Z_11570 [bacterium]